MSNWLSGLTEPLTTLIHKISDATGILYEPTRIRHRAEAEAVVDKIKAQTDIEITDLRQRAEQRRIAEDIRQQKNIEDIIAGAELYLEKEAKPDAMDDDWVANYFDKARIVSDSEMQSVWSRVLAGEANRPGTYSKRTVNFLCEIDKEDANLFTNLCGFSWCIDRIGSFVPLVFDTDAKIYDRHGIDFDTLTHLDSIGLIQFNHDGFAHVNDSNIFVISYRDNSPHGRQLTLKIPPKYDSLPIGKVVLTQIGRELAPICGSEPVDDFFEFAKNYWAGRGCYEVT